MSFSFLCVEAVCLVPLLPSILPSSIRRLDLHTCGLRGAGGAASRRKQRPFLSVAFTESCALCSLRFSALCFGSVLALAASMSAFSCHFHLVSDTFSAVDGPGTAHTFLKAEPTVYHENWILF